MAIRIQSIVLRVKAISARQCALHMLCSSCHNHHLQEASMNAQQKVLNGLPSVKVAIVQTPPAFLNKDKTLDIACQRIEEAAANGANVIAFSEAWVSGYPYWGEGWESRLGDWIDVRTAFYDNALMIPSDDTRRLCEAAAKANAVVIMGCNELDSEVSSHTIYNTLLFIDNHGAILGRHRKIMPTFVERA